MLDRLKDRLQLDQWQQAPKIAATVSGGLVQHSSDLCDAFGSERSRLKTSQGGVAYHNVALWLIKPETMMNRSGNTCRKLLRQPPALPGMPVEAFRLKSSPRTLNKWDEIVVVCDDTSLEFGQVRLKYKGGSGGQNGLKDIISRVGSDKLTRLRVGVGLPQGLPLDKHVLSRFEPQQQDLMPDLLDFCCELLLVYFHRGFDIAASLANTPQHFERYRNSVHGGRV